MKKNEKELKSFSTKNALVGETDDVTVMDGETASPPANGGVDYEAEYRKQTGRDFVTGEYAVQ